MRGSNDYLMSRSISLSSPPIADLWIDINRTNETPAAPAAPAAPAPPADPAAPAAPAPPAAPANKKSPLIQFNLPEKQLQKGNTNMDIERRCPRCGNSHTGQCRPYCHSCGFRHAGKCHPPAMPANTTTSQEGPAVVWNGGVHITVNAAAPPRSTSAGGDPPRAKPKPANKPRRRKRPDKGKKKAAMAKKREEEEKKKEEEEAEKGAEKQGEAEGDKPSSE
ncbi:hypothetical protein IFM46972_06077 [Aspergillus udagawae]|uniref:Uncharacterized protein n=1 Tax=Aspergillus udagawae TaxID=91492 RepID=A0A8H3RW03_9EURO|nr:hypothetical protein IFM46972_06077 [Aspergillus udagawae]